MEDELSKNADRLRGRPKVEMTETGDALAKQVAAHLHANEGTAAAWGIEIEQIGEGFARVGLTLRSDMTNGHGTAHGGIIFALADTAFAYACNSRNVSTVAAAASIIFLSPVQVGEQIIAEAREDASVGRSGAYSVAVHAGDGRPVAQFQGFSRTVGGSLIGNEN